MQCEMRRECQNEVTHIGSKGYIYCSECAVRRRHSGYERTRKMRVWELNLVRNGKQVPSYKPIPKPS